MKETFAVYNQTFTKNFVGSGPPNIPPRPPRQTESTVKQSDPRQSDSRQPEARASESSRLSEPRLSDVAGNSYSLSPYSPSTSQKQVQRGEIA